MCVSGKKLTITLFSTLAFLLSCNNEVEPTFETRDLFTLSIPLSINTSDTDNWIIASDENGEIIACKPFESGQEIMLAGDIIEGSSTLVITLATGRTGQSIRMHSFTDVAIGSQWTLPEVLDGAPQIGESISLELSNFPTVKIPDYILSSLDGPVIHIAGTYNRYFVPKSPCDIFFIVFANYPGSVPKYKKLKSVVTGDTMKVDFNTLSNFDHLIKVNPGANGSYNAIVRGYDGDMAEVNQNHSEVLCYFEKRSADPEFDVSYNDGYNFYKTQWQATTNSGSSFFYEKTGAPPESENFDMPAVSVAIASANINDFRITSGTEFEFNTTTWLSPGNLIWSVTRPGTSRHKVLKHLPQEIISKYVQNLEFRDTMQPHTSIFFEVKSGLTYEDYLQEMYNPMAFQLEEREYFSITKRW